MTVTIQFNSPEDFKLVEPLLLLFKEYGVRVQVDAGTPSAAKKSKNKAKGTGRKLHGIVQLPNDFDYKAFMASELLSKHAASNG